MPTPPPPPPPIRACLFDMDGLLIDSEDLYTLVTNSVLATYNRPPLPWPIKAKLQGRPGPAAAKIFSDWAKLPISIEEFWEMQKPLQAKYFVQTKMLPGVKELLQGLSRSTVEMGLATSSHRYTFDLKTKHLPELTGFFDEECVVLGDDSRIPAGRGKPAPDIYSLALETINARLRREGKAEVRPEECLVFEDSVPGVEAGRRAGMQVVWCPHVGLLGVYEGREKEVLAGLTGEHVEDEVKTELIQKDVSGDKARTKGWPGEIDDGWGLQVKTLENFPFGRYGIDVPSQV